MPYQEIKKLLKILLFSEFTIFLCLLHTVATVSTCLERYAEGKSFSDMLWQFPLGLLVILAVLGFYTCLAYKWALWKVKNQ